ncbi:MAG: ABC transporter permease [Thermoleophilaceae bacterium]|nr:ABC transporter permease [Thermoleophilaceae bacterium]
MARPADSASAAPPVTTTEILPARGWRLPALSELWRHADLVYFLAKRDVTVRYKQTAVGALWAVLQPLLLAGIFSAFLGQLTDVPSGKTPYALFALAGMTMWLFLAGAIGRCSESTLASSELISKVYFPRIVVPLAAAAAPTVDFAASFVVLVIVLVVSGHAPGPEVLLAPAVFVLALVIALGIGLWLSALVVRYRDVSLGVPFMIMVLLFVTPILYPLSLVPDGYREVYALNPLVGVLETFRWTVLPDASAPGTVLLISAATAVVLFITGLLYFARAEQRFADVI